MVDVDRLIESSSLGTRAARRFRHQTTPAQVEDILRRARNQTVHDQSTDGTGQNTVPHHVYETDRRAARMSIDQRDTE